ncbi:MAG: cysteine desulfurase [Roseburia sp.]|nr:cysteine desulfurase [Roseburia sp.]
MKTPIYLDYAATTPVSSAAAAAAAPYYAARFFNPLSAHSLGQKAAAAIELSREKCAAAINARASEIVFTSGGTDAVNKAVTYALDGAKKRIVISAIEHDSVFAVAEHIGKYGYTVDCVSPSADGVITPEALEKAMDGDTALVCVMTVNNITGVIQPISELCAIAHRHGALFFTDAVQAVNSLSINVRETDVDFLAVSGHKFYAPKGVGVLYVRSGIKKALNPFGYGKHEGTPDVPSVAAIGEAAEIAARAVSENREHAEKIKSAFLGELNCGIEVCNGVAKIPDIVSVTFDGVNGGRLAVALSIAGVCCSVGSACSAGSATPPRALSAMGLKNADSSVRFSFGAQTTADEAVCAARIVNDTVARLTKKS